MSLAITYPDEFFTTTAAQHLKHLRSQQFRPNRLAAEFLQKAVNVDGGERVIIPFDVQEHSVTTQIVTGYEAADTNVQTIFAPGYDTWAFNTRPVIYSWVDDAKNSGSKKLIDIIKSRVENTELALMQQLERRLLRQQAIAAMSDINTLNGDDETGGFLEAGGGVTVGTQDNTVHNVSKLTYASLVGFQNQIGDASGDASANLIGALARIHNRVQEGTKDATQLSGFVSLDAAENFIRLTQSQAQYGQGAVDPIALTIKAAGLTYKQCSNMPDAGTVTGSNNDEWSFLIVDHAAIKLQILKGLKFAMTPWRDVGGGHDAKLCFFRFGGQLTIQDWRSSAVLIGADTY